MKREWLIQKRKAYRMEQVDVANHCHISRQMYNFVEAGKRNPSPPIAKRIAAVLGFSEEWYKLLEDGTYPDARSKRLRKLS